MAEYAILLGLSTGTQWLERAARGIADDPVLLWGGVAALGLLAVWVLKPSR